MPADLTNPFNPSCCDGEAYNAANSTQFCGCDPGADYKCERHRHQQGTVENPHFVTGLTIIDGLNSKTDKASYIHTFTGKWFAPLDPDPEMICIEDIAHALALQCRYTGHCKFPWSVAQHSLLVTKLVENHPDSSSEDMLWAILHDASEAYLVDVPRPVKKMEIFWSYRLAEQALMETICKKYQLAMKMPEVVHWADEQALSIEAHVLMNDVRDWNLEAPLEGYTIREDRDWRSIEYKFKVAFWDLCRG